ncbi:glycosyltransferase [Demequina sp.]|uniref:glycosyltransferase family 2 protein n=1 Tax=Demequina sp. TaxID=2050685 RepID=UPI0025C40559|nr:glycosyltransferase [Demequina sp.]
MAKPRNESPKAPSAPRRSTARSGRLAAARSAAQAASQPTAAVLIVAHNQARRIAATVRASRAIPGVDLVLVVDDGSADNTQHLARKAGAVVVRHSHRRGRSVSIETGSAVIGMRDEDGKTPRAVLIMEPGLGHAAIGAAPLVEAVLESVADMAIGLTDGGSRATGATAGAARKAIASLSGWRPLQPLSRVRCVTREALEAALPLSHGAGLETGLTLDVIDAGLTVTEVECEMRHRVARKSARRPLTRAGQYRDVMIAISSRRIRLSLRSTQHAVEDTFHVASRADRPRGTEAPESSA